MLYRAPSGNVVAEEVIEDAEYRLTTLETLRACVYASGRKIVLTY